MKKLPDVYQNIYPRCFKVPQNNNSVRPYCKLCNCAFIVRKTVSLGYENKLIRVGIWQLFGLLFGQSVWSHWKESVYTILCEYSGHPFKWFQMHMLLLTEKALVSRVHTGWARCTCSRVQWRLRVHLRLGQNLILQRNYVDRAGALLGAWGTVAWWRSCRNVEVSGSWRTPCRSSPPGSRPQGACGVSKGPWKEQESWPILFRG